MDGASSSIARARSILDWALPALFVVLGLGAAFVYLEPFEDAFITFRYAEHLAHGLGFAYNPGEQVEGFTSFSWTVLLAGAARLGMSVPATATALSLLSGAAFVILVWKFAEQSARADGSEATLADRSFACALVVASGTFGYFAASGMETLFFACLLCGGVLALLAEHTPLRAAFAGTLLALAAMTHPEGIGYAFVLLGALAFERSSRRFALHAAFACALCLVPFYAYRWAHFGYPFPNTFYAKASPSLALFLAGARRVEAWLTGQLFWVAVIACGWLFRRRVASRGVLLSAALFWAAVLQTIASGGDTFAFHRFLLPAVPAAATLVSAARREAQRHDLLGRRLVRASAGLAVAWVALVLAASFLPLYSFATQRETSEYHLVQSVNGLNRDYFLVGAWLRDHAPKDALIAVNAAGIVPYTSGLRTLDMLGLTDAHIAHAPITLGHGAIGHEKNDPAYVLARKPDYIFPGLPIPASRHLTMQEVAERYAAWFPFLPGDQALMTNSAFPANYRLQRAPLADGREILYFARRRHAD